MRLSILVNSFSFTSKFEIQKKYLNLIRRSACMFCFSFYKWVSQRHTLLIESSSFLVLIGNLISISSPFFHRKTLIRFHQVLFYRVHQFFVCCDDEAAADDAPYDVVVDDWVILDPSAPYDVDVVVFDWRRIASELDNPLPLRWIGVRVLSKEIIFCQMLQEMQ